MGKSEILNQKNEIIQSQMHKDSKGDKLVNTLISENTNEVWVVASKDNTLYVLNMCFTIYSDVDKEWASNWIDAFDNLIVCSTSEAAFELASGLQGLIDKGYDVDSVIEELKASYKANKEEN